ncbi:MAG: hypothetical protein Q4G63_11185 [Bacteroidia bacterium]|nr:hypothetical protein [Bacteroidia bacterium]
MYDSTVDSLRSIIKNQIMEFKPDFIGYKTVHKFRAKNRAGNYSLSSIEYVFDKKMKEILSQETISDDDDEELTIKDIIRIFKENDTDTVENE